MYVLFEGLDGTGKDLQTDRLVQRFLNQGQNPLRVHEPDEAMPGGTELRALLKSGEHQEAQLGLFVANRMALQASKVRPALAENRPVISVRSFVSTLVYQQEQGYPLDWLIDIHRMLPCKATHLILLDLDPEVALSRATWRPGHMEFYEKLDIQRRNRQRYLDLVSMAGGFMSDPKRVGVINALGTPDEVEARITEFLSA